MRHIALIEAHDEVANALSRKLIEALETGDGQTIFLIIDNNEHAPEKLLTRHYNLVLVFVAYDKFTNTKGLRTAEAVKSALPDTKVVLIGDDYLQERVEALKLDGWLLKQSFSPPPRLRDFVESLGIKTNRKEVRE